MSIYRYSEASVIQEVAFRSSSDRTPIALLSAREDIPAEQLLPIRRAMEAKGWNCVPAYVEGKNTLQVIGFKDAETLSGFLTSKQAVTGTPRITKEARDNIKPSLGDRVKRHSLKIAGLLNMAGDIGLLWSGATAKVKDPLKIAAGASYTLGALNLALYGSGQKDAKLHDATGDVATFIKGQTGALPQHSSLSVMEKHSGNGTGGFRSALLQNPGQITLGAYSTGAALMLGSGLQRARAEGRWNHRLNYGISSLFMKGASFAIKERNFSDEEKEALKRKGPLTRFYAWLQEKPLRLFGFGSFLTDSFYGLDTIQSYNQAKLENFKNASKTSFMFDFFTTAAYLASDLLAGISKKDGSGSHVGLNEEEKRFVEASAAEAMLEQSLEQQAGMAGQMGELLRKKHQIKGNKSGTVGQSIIEQAKHMKDNPWAVKSVREADPQMNR